MIIQSLLDTDLYKLTMMQAVLHHFPAAQAEYQFFCRSDDVDLRPYAHAIHAEIEQLAALRLSEGESSWLATLPNLSEDFIAHLARFRFDPRQVSVLPGREQLEITIRGPWASTILYEVPVLAIISETYFRAQAPELDFSTALMRLGFKAEMLLESAGADFSLIEFGTRRRYSQRWHEEMLRGLKNLIPEYLTGTSNVDLARRLGLRPMGTVAHEFFQACQALAPSLESAQHFALQTWLDEYSSTAGVALSDTYGTDAFLADFRGDLARRYAGVRQDSGDPIEWTERMLAHYESLGIDPRTKVFTYSDSLTIPRALEIYERYHEQAKLVFGIGTNLTNDVGPAPLNIVVKMTQLNGRSVAKISDDPGKAMSHDPAYLANLRDLYQRKAAG
jgi:nicotinate phosphoribosyltransferase